MQNKKDKFLCFVEPSICLMLGVYDSRPLLARYLCGKLPGTLALAVLSPSAPTSFPPACEKKLQALHVLHATENSVGLGMRLDTRSNPAIDCNPGLCFVYLENTELHATLCSNILKSDIKEYIQYLLMLNLHSHPEKCIS